MIFETHVAGIPCQCKVTIYHPPQPMRVYGPGMGDAEPGDDGEFEFQLLDRKGYRAKWLEAKLKDADRDRLYEEFNLERQAELWDHDNRCF